MPLSKAEIDELNAILAMSDEEAEKAKARYLAELDNLMAEFLGEDKPNEARTKIDLQSASATKPPLSKEDRSAIMQMSDEELDALEKECDKNIERILNTLLGKDSPANTPAENPKPNMSPSSERREKISKMSKEEALAFIEDRQNKINKALKTLLGEDKPNDTPVETASLSQSAPLPQKQPPAKDIWTVKPGQSAAYHVPYEVNRRHRSPKRRYRDKEVAHGFPVANLREFFFFSRRLASAAYDAPNRRLYLKFDASTLYQYFDVPENVARDLLKMVSPGSYAYHHICYSFKYERLPFPPPPTVKAKTGSRAKASISQERRNELASLSPEQLKARLEKNEKRRMEILAKLLGKDKPTDTPTARPDQEAK